VANHNLPCADTNALTSNGVFWKRCSGAAWCDVPERYGKWRTVYDRFALYRDDGTLERILEALRLRLDSEGYDDLMRLSIDWTTWMIDATSIRASRAAAGARKRGMPPPKRRLTTR
jgi:transposase